MEHRVAVGVLIIFLIIGLSIGTLKYLDSRPAWQLSARNSTHGVKVEVFKANENVPTYSFQLDGQTIERNVDRVTRRELLSNVGTTLFHDDTLKPGRWTIEIDGVEFDITERLAVVDGNEEFLPRE